MILQQYINVKRSTDSKTQKGNERRKYKRRKWILIVQVCKTQLPNSLQPISYLSILKIMLRSQFWFLCGCDLAKRLEPKKCCDLSVSEKEFMAPININRITFSLSHAISEWPNWGEWKEGQKWVRQDEGHKNTWQQSEQKEGEDTKEGNQGSRLVFFYTLKTVWKWKIMICF